MRKVLLGSAIVIAGAAVGLPYAMGIMAQKSLQHQAEMVSKKYPYINLEIADYQRGWFSSTAEIKVSQPGLNGSYAGAFANYSVKETIKHGPILFTGHGIRFGQARIDLDFSMPTQFKQAMELLVAGQKDKPKYVNDAWVGFNGSLNSEFGISPFKFVIGGGQGEVDWKGLMVHAKVSRDLDAMHASVDFEGADVNVGPAKAEVGRLELNSITRKTQDDIWVGNLDLDFPSLEATMGGEQRLLLKGLVVNAEADSKDHRYDASYGLSLKKVVVKQIGYGPATFNLALRQLDSKTLGRLLKIVEQGQANGADEQVIMAAVAPLGMKLLSQGFELEVEKLNAELPEGVVDATAKLVVNKSDKPINNPQALIANVQADLQAVIPVKLAQKIMTSVYFSRYVKMKQQQAEQPNADQSAELTKPNLANMNYSQISELATTSAMKQLAIWEQAGILSKQSDNYKLVAKFAKGNLTVNGKQMFAMPSGS